MISRAMTAAMFSVLAMVGFVPLAHAVDKDIDGVVDVKKSDAGEVQSVAVVTTDGIRYVVTMDGKGKKLAADMQDKKVHVSGDVKEVDEKKEITLSSFNEKQD